MSDTVDKIIEGNRQAYLMSIEKLQQEVPKPLPKVEPEPEKWHERIKAIWEKDSK